MAKKKATAKKKAAVKRAAPKPPAPAALSEPIAGGFEYVLWEWFPDEGRFRSGLDLQRSTYSHRIDFGRKIESVECSLDGSGISPKVDGSSILLRCNNGRFEALVKLAEGKQQDPVLSDWAI